MGVESRFGGPSEDCMVGVVAGVTAWGVSLELLAKRTVLEKSGRGRRVWGRQWWRSQ